MARHRFAGLEFPEAIITGIPGWLSLKTSKNCSPSIVPGRQMSLMTRSSFRFLATASACRLVAAWITRQFAKPT